jgi:hypothetical protein
MRRKREDDEGMRKGRENIRKKTRDYEEIGEGKREYKKEDRR